MKMISTVIAFVFGTALGYSQTLNSKDTTVTFTSDPVNISYSPSDLFSKISFATNKFESGRPGMTFSLTTKPKQKTPNVRIDSIILELAKSRNVTFTTPYQDTVYYLQNGGLSLSTIHWLDKAQIGILQQQAITALILTVDGKPIRIKISKKSQRELSEAANRDFSTL